MLAVTASNEDAKLVTPLVSPDSEIVEAPKRGTVMVTVNGVVVGHCQSHYDAVLLREGLRAKRRSQEIPFDTTIAYVQDSWQSVVRIHADAGCLLRPVFDIKKLKEAKCILNAFSGAPHAYCELWAQLFEVGVIEYIDKDEEAIRMAWKNARKRRTKQNETK